MRSIVNPSSRRSGMSRVDIPWDLRKEGDSLRLSIEDNGIGMPENIREQIFSAFFTTKPVGEGTGLGLSITRSIIEEKHDGKIEVESKEGEFTRFIFLIPLTK